MSRLLVEPLPRLRVGGMSDADGTCEHGAQRQIDRQREAGEVPSRNAIEAPHQSHIKPAQKAIMPSGQVQYINICENTTGSKSHSRWI